MSNSMPGCARSTRMRCVACSPVSEAVASSQVSAIQRRRVMVTFSRKVVGCRENTKGNAFAFPFGVAFTAVAYFFFAAFFAGFLAAFLAAFFVAIVFYSPFS